MNPTLTAVALLVVTALGLSACAEERVPVGEGPLNLIAISDAKGLAGVDEILAFRAFEIDPRTGTIQFLLELKDVDYNTGIGPTLNVLRRGERIAILKPEVARDDTGFVRNTPYNLIEFCLAPNYVAESNVLLQFHPNTEQLVTYQIHARGDPRPETGWQSHQAVNRRLSEVAAGKGKRKAERALGALARLRADS